MRLTRPAPASVPVFVRVTPAQGAMMAAIVNLTRELGYPPTLRELGRHLGIGSTNGVNDHLVALELRGLIARELVSHRSVRVTGAPFVVVTPRWQKRRAA